MGKQFEEFVAMTNFEIAFNRIKYSTRSRYKNFYKRDLESFSLFLTQNIDQTINDIKEQKYAPTKIERYYIPKKNNLARPISLLYFIDLLVYQALCNVIEKYSTERRSVFINNFSFANTPNKDDSDRFQFQNWRYQWKKFNKKIINSFKEGFNYVAEYDVASFYDTIDHTILIEILNKIGIEKDILIILEKCLKSWVKVTNFEIEFEKHCGIPQGPDCSGILAEVYLSYLDEKFLSYNKFHYFRYADDIRIMAVSELECQKAISLLDLFCKDISLIAQSSKISIIKIRNSKELYNYVDSSGIKFSNVNIEYRSSYSLKQSTHNKLKKKLFETFDKNNERYLNKTILKFVFYKLNGDDEIRDIILNHWDELYLNFEGVVHYLNKYYSEDEKVLNKIFSVLENDDILYQYNKAVIFSEFASLKYNPKIYEILKNSSADRFWIIKYYAMDWLFRNGKVNLIRHLFDNCSTNYFIERKKFVYEFAATSDNDEREQLVWSNYGKDVMLSLQALHLQIISNHNFTSDNCSDYILNIFQLDKSDFIMNYMKNKYKINKKDCKGFVCSMKKDRDKYWEAIRALNDFDRNINYFPDNALMNLDLFHNIILDMLLPDMDSDFGVKIEHIREKFPCTYFIFSKIHDARNQETTAHYKDSKGNVRIPITKERLINLIDNNRLRDAYTELFLSFN